MKALSLSLLLCSSTHHYNQRCRPVSWVSILAGTLLTANLCLLHTSQAEADTYGINRWKRPSHLLLPWGEPISVATEPELIQEADLLVVSVLVVAIEDVKFLW